MFEVVRLLDNHDTKIKQHSQAEAETRDFSCPSARYYSLNDQKPINRLINQLWFLTMNFAHVIWVQTFAGRKFYIYECVRLTTMSECCCYSWLDFLGVETFAYKHAVI